MAAEYKEKKKEEAHGWGDLFPAEKIFPRELNALGENREEKEEKRGVRTTRS